MSIALVTQWGYPAKNAANLSPIDVMESESSTDSDQDVDIPSSPQLPTPKPLAFPFIMGKKRAREDYPTTSSDAPMFSSDDASTSVENYLQPRSKRQYRGPWWNTSAGSTVSGENPRKKREFERAVDSGVWMDSDESVESEEQLDGQDMTSTSKDSQSIETMLTNKVNAGTVGKTSWESPTVLRAPKQSQQLAETDEILRHVLYIVQRCVDNGLETIDLSSLNLAQIPSSILKPLHYLTKQKTSDALPPSREAYAPLMPSLRIFMSSNRLQSLPGEIYKLRDLSVLSLRQNQLTELAPAIGRLSNLQELNVSANQLRWLPWEILALVGSKLTTLSIHPNPFIQPHSVDSFDISSYGAEIHSQPTTLNIHASVPNRYREPEAMATTTVSFLDINGVPCRGYALTPFITSHYIPTHAITPDEERSTGKDEKQQSFVPSLTELALQSCTKSQYISELPFLFPDDISPRLSYLLQVAWQTAEAGGKQCSVCGRNYLIPRTEWIEWWDCVPSKKSTFEYVPLIRRGCSWQCLPDFGAPPLSYIPLERQQCGWSSSP